MNWAFPCRSWIGLQGHPFSDIPFAPVLLPFSSSERWKAFVARYGIFHRLVAIGRTDRVRCAFQLHESCSALHRESYRHGRGERRQVYGMDEGWQTCAGESKTVLASSSCLATSVSVVGRCDIQSSFRLAPLGHFSVWRCESKAWRVGMGRTERIAPFHLPNLWLFLP